MPENFEIGLTGFKTSQIQNGRTLVSEKVTVTFKVTVTSN